MKWTRSNYTNCRPLKNISSSLKLNVAFSLKDLSKVFFCPHCFRQNHVSYMSFQGLLHSRVFLNPFPYKMRTGGGGLFQKQEAHLVLMGKSRQITTEKNPFSEIGEDKHEGFCTAQCYFWEHIHLIWNHSEASPKKRHEIHLLLEFSWEDSQMSMKHSFMSALTAHCYI